MFKIDNKSPLRNTGSTKKNSVVKREQSLSENMQPFNHKITNEQHIQGHPSQISLINKENKKTLQEAGLISLSIGSVKQSHTEYHNNISDPNSPRKINQVETLEMISQSQSQKTAEQTTDLEFTNQVKAIEIMTLSSPDSNKQCQIKNGQFVYIKNKNILSSSIDNNSPASDLKQKQSQSKLRKSNLSGYNKLQRDIVSQSEFVPFEQVALTAQILKQPVDILVNLNLHPIFEMDSDATSVMRSLEKINEMDLALNSQLPTQNVSTLTPPWPDLAKLEYVNTPLLHFKNENQSEHEKTTTLNLNVEKSNLSSSQANQNLTFQSGQPTHPRLKNTRDLITNITNSARSTNAFKQIHTESEQLNLNQQLAEHAHPSSKQDQPKSQIFFENQSNLDDSKILSETANPAIQTLLSKIQNESKITQTQLSQESENEESKSSIPVVKKKKLNNGKGLLHHTSPKLASHQIEKPQQFDTSFLKVNQTGTHLFKHEDPQVMVRRIQEYYEKAKLEQQREQIKEKLILLRLEKHRKTLGLMGFNVDEQEQQQNKINVGTLTTLTGGSEFANNVHGTDYSTDSKSMNQDQQLTHGQIEHSQLLQTKQLEKLQSQLKRKTHNAQLKQLRRQAVIESKIIPQEEQLDKISKFAIVVGNQEPVIFKNVENPQILASETLQVISLTQQLRQIKQQVVPDSFRKKLEDFNFSECNSPLMSSTYSLTQQNLKPTLKSDQILEIKKKNIVQPKLSVVNSEERESSNMTKSKFMSCIEHKSHHEDKFQFPEVKDASVGIGFKTNQFMSTTQKIDRNHYQIVVNDSVKPLPIKKASLSSATVNLITNEHMGDIQSELIANEPQSPLIDERQFDSLDNFKYPLLNNQSKVSRLNEQSSSHNNSPISSQLREPILPEINTINQQQQQQDEQQPSEILLQKHFQQCNQIFPQNMTYQSRQQISDIYTKRRYTIAGSYAKGSKRIALQNLLTPDQLEIFNQLSGKKDRKIRKASHVVNQTLPANRLLYNSNFEFQQKSSEIPNYGAMLVKSNFLAKQFDSQTSLLKKQSKMPTYMIFNEVNNIEASLKMTKALCDSILQSPH